MHVGAGLQSLQTELCALPWALPTGYKDWDKISSNQDIDKLFNLIFSERKVMGIENFPWDNTCL